MLYSYETVKDAASDATETVKDAAADAANKISEVVNSYLTWGEQKTKETQASTSRSIQVTAPASVFFLLLECTDCWGDGLTINCSSPVICHQ